MDDLISRQALMKEFADFVKRSNNSDFAPTPTWNDAVSLVESMPSAQPDGRWEIIHPGETGYSAGDFRCSVCGQPNRCYHLTKYCCNCGARMVNRGKVKKEKR